MKKFINYYLNSIILRNLTATLFDLCSICLLVGSVYFCIITPIEKYNWYYLLGIYFLFALFKICSLRIRVTRVCPVCFENRGIDYTSTPTGRTDNYNKYVEGDFWMYSEDVEYLEKTFCRYCNYCVENYRWYEKHWRGDLTEEAKLRRQEEANKRAIEQYKMAQTQAIIDAHEQIRNKRRYY